MHTGRYEQASFPVVVSTGRTLEGRCPWGDFWNMLLCTHGYCCCEIHGLINHACGWRTLLISLSIILPYPSRLACSSGDVRRCATAGLLALSGLHLLCAHASAVASRRSGIPVYGPRGKHESCHRNSSRRRPPWSSSASCAPRRDSRARIQLEEAKPPGLAAEHPRPRAQLAQLREARPPSEKQGRGSACSPQRAATADSPVLSARAGHRKPQPADGGGVHRRGRRRGPRPTCEAFSRESVLGRTSTPSANRERERRPCWKTSASCWHGLTIGRHCGTAARPSSSPSGSGWDGGTRDRVNPSRRQQQILAQNVCHNRRWRTNSQDMTACWAGWRRCGSHGPSRAGRMSRCSCSIGLNRVDRTRKLRWPDVGHGGGFGSTLLLRIRARDAGGKARRNLDGGVPL